MNEILKLNIGIAGCGTMGLPMLEVLLKNKVKAFGYDIKSKDNFPTLKNKFISSKTEFFDKSELCEGHNGLFKLNTPKTFIICSTLSPAFLKKFFLQSPDNITMIEAPMSGAPMRAKDASLTFMVGSKVNEFEKILPILNILGDKIYHIGEFGSGMSVKVLNNFVASCSVVAVRHVLSEAKNLNITTNQLLKILNSSSGQTWFSENLENIDWAKENYETDNTIAILEKDVRSFLDGLADSNSSSNNAMVNFQNALLNGLKNIPTFPNN